MPLLEFVDLESNLWEFADLESFLIAHSRPPVCRPTVLYPIEFYYMLNL